MKPANPFSERRSDLLVIGGGVIGVCAAYYLLQEGFRVTLLEADQVNAGSTSRNAGLIIPSDSLPVPGPGVLTQGLRWLLDSASPFYIQPSLDPALLRWLWDFQGACREKQWQVAAPLLTELSEKSVGLFEEILDREGIFCEYHRQGLLLLYERQSSYDAGQALVRKLGALGIQGRALAGADLRDLYPPARQTVAGGIYFQPDAHLDPALFTAGLAQRAEEQGLQLIENCEVLDFQRGDGVIQSLKTTRGEFFAEQVVLAAGAWTARLGKKLDLRLPVQPAKGYSITVQRPDQVPEIPLLLDEAKIAVTPLGETLRFAGTLELAGLNLEINANRVDAILENASRYLEVDIPGQPLVEIWRGLRPCTPDGLPIIGRSGRIRNLIVASGHCMLGVSQGTMTGKLVAEAAAKKQPAMDLAPFHPDRF